MKTTAPFIYILHEQRSQQVKYIDGISGKIYTFEWRKDIPDIGNAYVYEPKSQQEIDDIFESQQRYQIFFYSMYFPGMFDKSETAKAAEPETDPTDQKEKSNEPEELEPLAHFEPIADNELGNELAKIEDKDLLILVAETHGGKAPKKQAKLETIRAAAHEAILDYRANQESDDEPDSEPEPEAKKEPAEPATQGEDLDI